MGIIRSNAAFYLEARARGVDFSRTLTLGRQRLYLSPADLTALAARYRPDLRGLDHFPGCHPQKRRIRDRGGQRQQRMDRDQARCRRKEEDRAGGQSRHGGDQPGGAPGIPQ